MLHKGAFRYQLSGWIRPLSIFYFVILCIYLVLLFGLPMIQAATGAQVEVTGGGSSFTGTEMASMIFLFVCGICSFREEFRFLAQNGCSRKTVCISWLSAAMLAAATMAIIDTVLLTAVAAASGHWGITTSILFETFFGAQGNFSLFFGSIFFCFCLYAVALCAGYFINIAYYRMSKGWKIGVSIGVPVFFLFCLPLIDTFLGGYITVSFGSIAMLFFINAWSFDLTCLVAATILICCCWLMMRRAAVKPPVG